MNQHILTGNGYKLVVPYSNYYITFLLPKRSMNIENGEAIATTTKYSWVIVLLVIEFLLVKVTQIIVSTRHNNY